jgi:hypothetical protein
MRTRGSGFNKRWCDMTPAEKVVWNDEHHEWEEHPETRAAMRSLSGFYGVTRKRKCLFAKLKAYCCMKHHIAV